MRALTISSYVSMFFIGVGTTIVGAAARNIGLSPYQIGLMLAVQNLGFILSVIISGALSDAYEKTRILLVGSIILAAAFYTFYLTGLFQVNLLIMFFIGIGTGSYEGVTDAMLLDLHKKNESLYINVNHFFVTFGSLMIALYLIFLQMNWRHAMTHSGIAVSLLVVFFTFCKLEKSREFTCRLSERIKFLIRERTVSILFFATICSVGIELGSIGIMTTYLMEFRNFNQVTSKIGLIIFLSGIASGRLLIGYFSKKEHIPGFIALLFGSCAVFMSALYSINLEKFTYVLIYFTGMTVSALLPLIITLAGLTYKEHSGTVLGIIKIAIPVGGTLSPFLFSMISKYSSFRISLMLFPFIALAGFLVLIFHVKGLKTALLRGE